MDWQLPHRSMAAAVAACVLVSFIAIPSYAQDPISGRMITIRGSIDSSVVQRTAAAIREATQAGAEIIIFDLQVGPSDFGACYDMANTIAQIGGSVRRTVAFIDKPLTGNAVLVALACDEIVMASDAKIGDVEAAGDLKARERAVFESIAIENGHGKWIAAGLADKGLRLYEVDTPNGKTIKSADELPEFEKTARVLRKEVIKEAGQQWILTPELAQQIGLVQLVKNSRKDVAIAYGLSELVAADDATYTQAVNPCIVRIDGIVNQRALAAIHRRLQDAQRRGSTLLFVQIDAGSGDEVACSGIMDALHGFAGRKIAWVPERASGPATLLLFGCDELVMGKNAVVGDFLIPEDEANLGAALSEAAVDMTRESKYPSAIVRGLVDRQVAIWEVRNKQNLGVRSFRTADELEAEGEDSEWEKVRQVKEAGSVMTVTGGDQAKALDLAVAVIETQDQLLKAYAVEGPIPVLQATWVDGLVNGLTSPGATVFLLVVGMTCLYIEFQMPGFGVAGLLSAVCFVLFFWARFLSETANSLEIVMFLLGLILLALELFVFPGFGVAGVVGMILIFASLILASQSFPWPTTERETKILMGNMFQLFASFAVFVGVAIALARFFPSIPLFNRMVLPPPDEVVATAPFDELDDRPIIPYEEIVGEVGMAASPLRPAGRMKLGNRYYDVITNGEFVEQGRPVEVVEVLPNRILVRASAS